MPRSRHTRTLLQFTAMQLILSMEEPNEPKYPNILYVIAKDENDRMIPPVGNEEGGIQRGLELMRDLLTLIDKEVYIEFRNALMSNLQVGDVILNDANMRACVHISMTFLQTISARVKTEMWQDPPHPCAFIMREVVTELLATAGLHDVVKIS